MSTPARALTTRRRVGEIFARDGFRRFFAARLISQFGDGVFQLASFSAFIFEPPSSNPALDTLKATAISLLPFSLIGPFTGVFIDRWERRTILTWVPAGRALIAASAPVAALAGGRSVSFMIVVVLVLSSNRFFLSTMSAVLPQLVPEDDLVTANAVATTGGSVANVIGLAVGAPLAEALGGSTAAGFAAIGFGAAAIAARRVPVHRGFTEEPASMWADILRVLRELRAGIGMLRGSVRSVFALSAISSVQLLVGVMVGTVTVFFIGELGLGIASSGRLLAFLSVGIFAGVLIVPVIANRVRHDRLIPWSFVLSGTVTVLAALEPSRLGIELGTMFVGVSYALAKIPVDTIVQQEMPDAFRGRAFAVYDMLFNVARVGGIGIAAMAIELGSGSGGLMRGLGAFTIAIAGALWWWERRLGMFRRTRRARKQPAVEDLLLPGELVTVRSHGGGRADEDPRTIVVGGHELPIDAVHWRAVIEEHGRRRHAFVVGVGGRRVRLSLEDERWEIERVLGDPPTLSADTPGPDRI